MWDGGWGIGSDGIGSDMMGRGRMGLGCEGDGKGMRRCMGWDMGYEIWDIGYGMGCYGMGWGWEWDGVEWGSAFAVETSRSTYRRRHGDAMGIGVWIQRSGSLVQRMTCGCIYLDHWLLEDVVLIEY